MSQQDADPENKARQATDLQQDKPSLHGYRDREKRQSLLLLKRKFAEISAMIEGTAHEARGLVAWKLAQHSTRNVKISQEDRKQLDDSHRRRLADIASRQALQAVRGAMGHKWAWPFNQPVDTEKYRDYLLVVQQPMDFGTIKTKCEAGQYSTPDQVLYDARLVFDNARKYNPPGTDVYLMAQTVQDKFMERWKAQVEPKVQEERAALLAAEAALKRQLSMAAMEKQSMAMDGQVGLVLSTLEDIQHRISETKSLAAMMCDPMSAAELDALTARLRRLSGPQLEPIISLLMHTYPALGMEKSDFDLDLHSYDALLLRQLDYYATSCDLAGLLEPADQAGNDAAAGEEITRTIPFGSAAMDTAPRCPVKFPNVAIGAGLKARPRADLQLQDPAEVKAPWEPSLRPILSQSSAGIKAAANPLAPDSPLTEPQPMAASPVAATAGLADAHFMPASTPLPPSSPPTPAVICPHPPPGMPPAPGIDWASLLPLTTSRSHLQHNTTIFSEPIVTLSSASLHPLPQPPVASSVLSLPAVSAATVTQAGSGGLLATGGRLPPGPGLRHHIQDGAWLAVASQPHPSATLPMAMQGGNTAGGSYIPLVLPAGSAGGPVSGPGGPLPLPGALSPGAGGIPQAVHAMLNPVTFPGLRTSSGQGTAVAVGGMDGGSRAAGMAGGSVEVPAGRSMAMGGHRLLDGTNTAVPDPLSQPPWAIQQSAPLHMASSLPLPSSSPLPGPGPTSHPSLGPHISAPPSANLSAPLPASSLPISAPPSSLPTSLLPTTFAMSAPSLSIPMGMINASSLPSSSHPTSSSYPLSSAPHSSLVANAATIAHAMRGVRGAGFSLPSMLSGGPGPRSLHLGQPVHGQPPAAGVTHGPVTLGAGPNVAAGQGSFQAGKDGTVIYASTLVAGTCTSVPPGVGPIPVASGGSGAGGANATVSAAGTTIPAGTSSSQLPSSSTAQPPGSSATNLVGGSMMHLAGGMSTPLGGEAGSTISAPGPSAAAPPSATKSPLSHNMPQQPSAHRSDVGPPTSTPYSSTSNPYPPLLASSTGHPISILNLSGPLSPTLPPAKPGSAHILPVFSPPQAVATVKLPAGPLGSGPADLTLLAPPSSLPAGPPGSGPISIIRTSSADLSILGSSQPAAAQLTMLNLQGPTSTGPSVSQPAPTVITPASVANPVLPVWHAGQQLSGITLAVLPASGSGPPTLVAASQGQVPPPHPAALQLLGQGGRPIQVVPVQSLGPQQQQRLQQLNLQALSQHLMQQAGGQVIAVHPIQPSSSTSAAGAGQAVLQLASGATMLQLPTILPAASHLLQPQKSAPQPQHKPPLHPQCSSPLPTALSLPTPSAKGTSKTGGEIDVSAKAASAHSPMKSTHVTALGASPLPLSSLMPGLTASLDTSKPSGAHSAPTAVSQSPAAGLPHSAPAVLSQASAAALACSPSPAAVLSHLAPASLAHPSTTAPSHSPANLSTLLGPMSSIAAVASSALAGTPLPVHLAGTKSLGAGLLAFPVTSAVPVSAGVMASVLTAAAAAATASATGTAARTTAAATGGMAATPAAVALAAPPTAATAEVDSAAAISVPTSGPAAVRAATVATAASTGHTMGTPTATATTAAAPTPAASTAATAGGVGAGRAAAAAPAAVLASVCAISAGPIAATPTATAAAMVSTPLQPPGMSSPPRTLARPGAATTAPGPPPASTAGATSKTPPAGTTQAAATASTTASTVARGSAAPAPTGSLPAASTVPIPAAGTAAADMTTTTAKTSTDGSPQKATALVATQSAPPAMDLTEGTNLAGSPACETRGDVDNAAASAATSSVQPGSAAEPVPDTQQGTG